MATGRRADGSLAASRARHVTCRAGEVGPADDIEHASLLLHAGSDWAELIYKVLLFEDDVVAAYRTPVHQMIRFAYDGEARPVFAIVSPNHNIFSVYVYPPATMPG